MLQTASSSKRGAAAAHLLIEGLHNGLADELRPETAEEMLAVGDNMIQHDISCKVAVTRRDERLTLLDGLMIRGLLNTNANPDYWILESTPPFLPAGSHVSNSACLSCNKSEEFCAFQSSCMAAYELLLCLLHMQSPAGVA